MDCVEHSLKHIFWDRLDRPPDSPVYIDIFSISNLTSKFITAATATFTSMDTATFTFKVTFPFSTIPRSHFCNARCKYSRIFFCHRGLSSEETVMAIVPSLSINASQVSCAK